MITLVGCGATTLIHGIGPPSAHQVFDVALRTGAPPTRTRGLPGIHGVGIGVQGTVAPTALAATAAGLKGLLQSANGGMFINGLQSKIDAIGNTPARTRFSGVTGIGNMGATPHMHLIVQPIVAHGEGMLDCNAISLQKTNYR